MISVAMTTFNGEKYIEKQIESILNQSMPVDEIIVCDDGSSDKTVELLKKYDVKIIENSENLGYKLNFKKAMDLCNGDYVFLCDQDDIWEIDKVKEMITIMKSNRDIHVLSSSFEYIDENDSLISTVLKKGYSNNNLYNKEVKPSDLIQVHTDEFIYGNYFQGCALVMDRNTKDFFINHFDDRIPHDWIISLYGSLDGGMYFLNKPLFQYRIHNQNSIGVSTLNQSTATHVNRAYQFEERYQKARDALYVLDILKLNCNNFYLKNIKEYNNIELFMRNHILYLKKKCFFKLLLQNRYCYYKKLKTYRGRIMDLLYCLK
ncbi:MAG: glycosyltransferase [Lactobacillus sp.]|nr:glycosyltransferase [Lactobacillus sp.]